MITWFNSWNGCVTKREGSSFTNIERSNPWCEPNLSWSIHPHPDLGNPNEHQNWDSWPYQLHSKGKCLTTYTICKKQIHTQKRSDFKLQNISGFNYRISTSREHKFPRKILFQNSYPSYLYLHSLPPPKDAYNKTTYSEYQTKWKKSVIGKMCSTTIPAYSLSHSLLC